MKALLVLFAITALGSVSPALAMDLNQAPRSASHYNWDDSADKTRDESGFGFRQVSPGVFRGGRPGKEKLMRFLSEKGIRNIVNLQGKGLQSQPGEKPREIAESEDLARRLGMDYHKHPFSTGTDHALTEEDRAAVFSAVDKIAEPANHPIYVHCFFGVDRTGVTVASYRILKQGCSFEKAKEEMYKEGGPWTPYVTKGQLAFLEELTGYERPGVENCPL
jgi:protein tyrosine/serine phosphatase